MKKLLPDWKALKLWPNQVDAVTALLSYFRRPVGSALIQMPTGTGKTGVIAVVAALRAHLGPVLIISPSRGITDQLIHELENNFWVNKLGVAAPWPTGTVKPLLPKNSNRLLRELEAKKNAPHVLIGTIQGWQRISETTPEFQTFLKSNSSCVIFDEGHREPAASWATAVRSIERPTVLCSATPFRNDFRYFNVNQKFHFYLPFETAVKRKVIRDVAFESIGNPPTLASYAKKVVEAIDTLIQANRIPSNAKVIVRCASRQTVEEAYNAFRQALGGRPDGVIGFHDRFAAADGNLTNRVIQIAKKSERYLIHQFKLIEGIDDPACTVLACWEDFTNERQLVQQIGRIVRHPSPWRSKADPAIVLTREGSVTEEMWRQFRDFDEECTRLETVAILNDPKLVRRVLDEFPNIAYIGGAFRRRIDLDVEDGSLVDDLKVPTTAVVMSNDGNRVAGQSLLERTTKCLDAEDRVVLHAQLLNDDAIVVVLSSSVSVSQHFARQFFPEFNLEVTVVCCVDGYCFLYDSGGLSPLGLGFETRVGPKVLSTLLPHDEATSVRMISLINSDISPGALRSRTLTAASLRQAMPFMADRAYIVSRCSGRTPQGRSRYLGLTRGRVSEHRVDYVDIDEFATWCESIAQQLNANLAATDLLTWFARPISPPDIAIPAHALLDLEELESIRFRRTTYDSETGAAQSTNLRFIEWDADIVEVDGDEDDDGTYDFEFVVSVEEQDQTKEYPVQLKYDNDVGKFRVGAKGLDEFVDVDKPTRNVPQALESIQPFRFIVNQQSVMYARGGFYDIDINELTHDRRLLEILVPCEEIEVIDSEKGTYDGAAANWTDDSLFNFIDVQLGKREANEPTGLMGVRCEYLVCEDLGKEAADFIAFDEDNPRVVFSHAKCKRRADRSLVSASALYDVCGQVQKNLRYMRPGNREWPTNSERWDEPWRQGTYVVPRLRTGEGAAAVFRQKLIDTLSRPATVCEAWIVAGNILSSGHLLDALDQDPVPPHVIQTLYLLNATYTVCKSFNVDLRVLCNP